jgi:hypothetical protein
MFEEWEEWNCFLEKIWLGFLGNDSLRIDNFMGGN